MYGKIKGFLQKELNEIKKAGAKIVFAKDAIVLWTPRKNLKEAFIMFFRFIIIPGIIRTRRTSPFMFLFMPINTT